MSSMCDDFSASMHGACVMRAATFRVNNSALQAH
jgi:hypothetical protein